MDKLGSPPLGDVRVSGRANTPSWVYRRRAHGPTLECHHSRQLHSLSVSQFGLFLGALLSPASTSPATVAPELGLQYCAPHSERSLTQRCGVEAPAAGATKMPCLLNEWNEYPGDN